MEFKPEDRICYCDHCHSHFFLKTVLVDKYKSGQEFKNGDSWHYKISGVLSSESPDILNINLENPTTIRAGDLVTEIKEKGKKIALINHSSGSWIDAKKDTINVLKDRYLRALKISVIFIIALSFAQLANILVKNPGDGLIAGAIIALVISSMIVLKLAEGSLNRKLDIKRTLSWLKNS